MGETTFTNAFVEGRVSVRGVRVLPRRWLVSEVLGGGAGIEPRVVKEAVAALGAATGCYPSAAPRRAT